jgi:hypothetical protein
MIKKKISKETKKVNFRFRIRMNIRSKEAIETKNISEI